MKPCKRGRFHILLNFAKVETPNIKLGKHKNPCTQPKIKVKQWFIGLEQQQYSILEGFRDPVRPSNHPTSRRPCYIVLESLVLHTDQTPLIVLSS